MITYKEFINEKLGINKDVKEFASTLYDIIVKEYNNNKPRYFGKNKITTSIFQRHEFYYPVEDIPPVIVNNKTINYFKIIINFKPWSNNEMRETVYEDGTLSLVLNMSPDYNFKIKESVIAHEILHLYQFSRNITKDNEILSDKNSNLHYDLVDLKSYYKSKVFREFNHMIYTSSDYEIDARVQECYEELKEIKTTKETFVKNLKNNSQYDLAIDLIKQEPIQKIRKDNPIKFVSNWIFLTNNMDALPKDSDYSGFLKVIYLISPQKLQDLYLKYFGPIKKPKIIKDNPNLELYIPRMFYDEISEKEANQFLDKWSKFFTKKGNKFLKKLARLQEFFD